MDKKRLDQLLIVADTTIKQAMQKLDETAEKILFAIDEGGRLLGTVTDGDIRRGIINGLEFGSGVERIMNRDFVMVRRNAADKEERIKEIMLQTRIEQIPVLDEKDGIVDVILWTDVLGDHRTAEKVSSLPNQVVIMAGGKGTRLDPFTRIFPKPLIPIGNKPVVEIIMEKFYERGFHRFLYTLNYKKEYLKLFLKENNFPYSIEFVDEEDFLGTAGSLALLKDRIDETFFVTNCDSIMEINLEEVLAWHKEQGASMTIIGCHNEIKIPFGVLEMSDGRLDRILEKPFHDSIINTGVYVMEPHIISYIPEGRHMDMNILINMIIEREKVSVYPICRGWIDIGQWEEYKRSVDKLRDTRNV